MKSKSISLLSAFLVLMACDGAEKERTNRSKAKNTKVEQPAPKAAVNVPVTAEAPGRCVQLKSVSHWANQLETSEAEAAQYEINLWADHGAVAPRTKAGSAHPGDSLPLLASTSSDYQVAVEGKNAWISQIQAEAVVDCE
jgi:hypothetical protein